MTQSEIKDDGKLNYIGEWISPEDEDACVLFEKGNISYVFSSQLVSTSLTSDLVWTALVSWSWQASIASP